MLFRQAQQTPTTVFSVAQMLAYRDTWTKPLDEDLEAKLAPPPPPERAPVKPLVKSDSGFKAGAGAMATKSEQLIRLVQSTLNKLTYENLEALMPPLLQPALFEPGVAKEVVDRIFDKSLDEPQFASLYAIVCLRMAAYEHEFLASSKTVRTSIVEKAQRMHEMQEQTAGTDEERERLRKRKLANIKFVGHLVERDLLSVKIVAIILSHACKATNIDDVTLEVAITLVDQVGKLIDEKTPTSLDAFFKFIDGRRSDESHSNRVRFLIMDLLDLRKRKWVRRTPAEVDPAAAISLETTARSGTTSASAKSAAAPADIGASLRGRDWLPPQLTQTETKDVTKKLVEMTADTSKETLRSLSTVLTDQNPSVNRAACVCTAIEQVCQGTNAGHVEAVMGSLALFEPLEMRAGLAWAVTNSLAAAITDDCPKYYTRFAPMLLHGLKDRAGFKLMVREVLAQATEEIDEIYADEGGDVSWDMAYVNMWTAFFEECKAFREAKSGVVPPLAEVLDSCLNPLPATGIAHRTMMDIVSALTETGFATTAELQNWYENHKNSQKLAFICSAMSLLV